MKLSQPNNSQEYCFSWPTGGGGGGGGGGGSPKGPEINTAGMSV